MKTYQIILLFCLFIIFSGSECDDGCDDSRKPLIEGSFRVMFETKDATGSPIPRDGVKCRAKLTKYYCGGDKSGSFDDEGETGEFVAGQYNVPPFGSYRFNFQNERDYVHVYLYVEDGLVWNKSYYYDAIENAPYNHQAIYVVHEYNNNTGTSTYTVSD